jgi:hypothetical protein
MSKLRRWVIIIGVALLITGIVMFLGISVSSDGSREFIDGRNDTRSMLAPLAVFAAGIACVVIGQPQ